MKSECTRVRVYDTNDSEQLKSFNATMEVYGESVQDHIKIDQYIIVVHNNIPTYKYNEKTEMYHGTDVSIAIASTVTSGARILMSGVKNHPDFDLYYTDTDSIITNNPLPSDLVGNQLGQFKLEYEINEAVFLAPKVYGFTTTSGQEIIKIKGVTKEVNLKMNLMVSKLKMLPSIPPPPHSLGGWMGGVLNNTVILTKKRVY